MANMAQCALPRPAPAFFSRGDINRLGEAFCADPRGFSAIHGVQAYRQFRIHCLTTTLRIVEAAKLPQHCLVSVRLKRLDSIRQKITRQGFNFALGQLDDIIGVRVVCQTFADARSLSGRMSGRRECYRQKDYTRQARDTGYRATHSIMRFNQALTADSELSVRFEVQVRSYYQHQWAIWSESKGEAVKAGVVNEEERAELRSLSDRIARWEENHANEKQADMPAYSSEKNIVVAWRQKPAPMLTLFLDADSAVKHLNYLETTRLFSRRDALLLVGASSRAEARRVLQMTHPLYTISRVIPPEFWMPPDS